MTIPISERSGFLIDSDPVCDRCGHGKGLHADAADVECVACVERGESLDCDGFAAVGLPWRLAPAHTGARLGGRSPVPLAGWR